MKSVTFARMLLCSASVVSCSGVAFAQSAPADSEAGGSEIVVTAFKRETSILKVPATVTVLGGDNLKTQGVNTLSDLQNVVPGVNITTGRDGVTVNIRGVTTTDTSSKGEQDIAFNIDGAYVGRGNARGAAFFDIERVEVLRGPQGTLYGRSSTGGAINVITKAPVLGSSSGYLKAEYGNYNAKRAEGAVNIPLGETVALRVAGAFNDRDGYSKPIGHSIVFNGTTYSFAAGSGTPRNDQNDATGRVSLLFAPTTDLSLRLTAAFGHIGGAGQAPAMETQLLANGDKGSGALAILASPVRAFVDSNFSSFDGRLNYKFGGNAQLDVMGSYQKLNHLQQGPAINSPAGNPGNWVILGTGPGPNSFGPAFGFFYQKNNVKTTQFEARVSNVDHATVDYVVGANYYKEDAGESGQSWAARIDNPVTSPSNYVFQNGPVNVTTHKAFGVFGQATWHLSDQIGVVGGLRYTKNEIDRNGRFSLPFNFGAGGTPWPDVAGNAICTFPNACLGAINVGGSKDSKVTFRVGVNFQVDPDNLLYLAVASGFKGGTFNDYDPATNGPAQVGTSSVVSYEAGYKGRPLPGLTFASSLFYYDFSRYPVTGGVQFPNGTNVQYTQITPVKLYGWENELSYQIAPNTSFNGSVSFLHSEFENFFAGQYAPRGVGRNFKDQALDMAPTFTATAALNHAFELGNDSKLRLRGALKYSNGYWVSNFGNAIRYWQPSFTRSDASVTYELEGGQYSLQFFVENIENKVQRVGGIGGYTGPNATYGGVGGSSGNFATGYVAGNGAFPTNLNANYLNFSVTNPRFYGVRLSAKF